MGKKEVLPPTKAGSAEERLEELVKNKTLLRCFLITENKDHEIFIEEGEFRAYSDGFEAVGAYTGYTTGILYLRGKNMVFYYDYKKDNEKQSPLKEN